MSSVHLWLKRSVSPLSINTTALSSPKTSISIQKRHPYTVNLNSEMLGDSTNNFCHCGDVSAIFVDTYSCSKATGCPTMAKEWQKQEKITRYMTLPDAVDTGAELPRPFSSLSSSPVDPQGPCSATVLHASVWCSSSAHAPCTVSTSSLCTRAALSPY